MDSLLQALARANLPVWLLLIFGGHAALYLALGTRTWLSTSLLATAFYAAVLLGARALYRQRVK